MNRVGFTVVLAAVIAGAYQFFSGWQCSWLLFWVIAIVAAIYATLAFAGEIIFNRYMQHKETIELDPSDFDEETRELMKKLEDKMLEQMGYNDEEEED